MTETGLAHHAPGHYASGHLHPDVTGLKFGALLFAVLGMQLTGDNVTPEVIRERIALGAQLDELLAAQRDLFVLVLWNVHVFIFNTIS